MVIYILAIQWGVQDDIEYSPHMTRDEALNHLVNLMIENHKIQAQDLDLQTLSQLAKKNNIKYNITKTKTEETYNAEKD
tara:strand:+ start:147 stop:383 length:237 start_codon:yes stop_codon:yes gene_type:complete